MNYLDILRVQLRVDEGEKPKPYSDSAGKITIGIGRNLTDVGISRGEQALMFDNDLVMAERTARALVPTFDSLSDVRKAVVMNMAFNMGYTTFATFVNTLKAINEHRFIDAASGMLLSKWATQVGARASRLAESIQSNQWKEPA